LKNRLRVLRAEFHLSQAQVAEKLGVARQTVHAIEANKFAPSLVLAYKLATMFGATIDDVFEPDPDDTMPSLLNDSHPSYQADRLGKLSADPRPRIFFGKARSEPKF
jgi:putative transcriptional regulator